MKAILMLSPRRTVRFLLDFIIYESLKPSIEPEQMACGRGTALESVVLPTLAILVGREEEALTRMPYYSLTCKSTALAAT